MNFNTTMSNHLLPGEDESINQLYATIKDKFEQEGVLREIRCSLQSKMIAMMQGKSQSNSFLMQRTHASAAEGDVRTKLLHQLIMEYFIWHGYHYTAEMFAMESSCENELPKRQCLESVLGTFDRKDLPILIQMVAMAWQKENAK